MTAEKTPATAQKSHAPSVSSAVVVHFAGYHRVKLATVSDRVSRTHVARASLENQGRRPLARNAKYPATPTPAAPTTEASAQAPARPTARARTPSRRRTMMTQQSESTARMARMGHA